MIELRLTQTAIDFWADVRPASHRRLMVAVADLASTPEVSGWCGTASNHAQMTPALALLPAPVAATTWDMLEKFRRSS